MTVITCDAVGAPQAWSDEATPCRWRCHRAKHDDAELMRHRASRHACKHRTGERIDKSKLCAALRNATSMPRARPSWRSHATCRLKQPTPDQHSLTLLRTLKSFRLSRERSVGSSSRRSLHSQRAHKSAAVAGQLWQRFVGRRQCSSPVRMTESKGGLIGLIADEVRHWTRWRSACCTADCISATLTLHIPHCTTSIPVGLSRHKGERGC